MTNEVRNKDSANAAYLHDERSEESPPPASIQKLLKSYVKNNIAYM